MSSEKINLVTACFASNDLEQDFRHANFEDDLRHNRIAMTFGFLLNLGYGFRDFQVLSHPVEAFTLRVIVVAVALAAIISLKIPQVRRYQEQITVLLMSASAMVVLFIVWREPTLENNYYVGLVQGCVYLTLLVRMSFFKASGILIFALVAFFIVTIDKPDSQEAALQTIILLTMFLICGFGVYFIQRNKRIDFLKTRIIEKQNTQLEALLLDTQYDNKRKVAALNMLLHVVKTPVHQIAGFADVVLMKLREEDESTRTNETIDSAQYIKTASDELRDGVSKLLAYHQLDELERAPVIEELHLGEILSDATAGLNDTIQVSISRSVKTISSDRRAIEGAVANIVSNIKDNHHELTALDIGVKGEGRNVVICFKDDGPGIDVDHFMRATKPLTEIENYLSGDGSNPTMGLRIVARIMEIIGGSISYKYDNGSMITLTFPEKPKSNIKAESSSSGDIAA